MTHSFRKKSFCPSRKRLPAYSRGHGEKKNRNTARIKFLVSKLGIEEFKRLVVAERDILPYDSAWTDYLKDVPVYEEKPLKPAAFLQIAHCASGWFRAVVCNRTFTGSGREAMRRYRNAAAWGTSPPLNCALLADLARKYT